ncbi:MAG: outer membrane beta-barrel protein [Bacteroidetes bacterium]|nr:outer membrane beta-barrel protein [Bacteroidota bacterium]
MRSILLSLCCICLLQTQSNAQTAGDESTKKKKFVATTMVETSLIQFANSAFANDSLKTIPRFSYFFNMGVDFNYQASKRFKPFFGLNLKNIGLITKKEDSVNTYKEKHRVYTVGVPIGVKLYFMKKNKLMFKAGADFSYAFNYRLKSFVNKDKKKSNEFFSDQTNNFMPSVFFGAAYSGVTASVNYYLTNFFNEVKKPGMEVNLITLGLGINFDQGSMKKKEIRKTSNSQSL